MYLAAEGVKVPDHVLSEHVEVRGWRCIRTPSGRGEGMAEDKGEIGKRETAD